MTRAEAAVAYGKAYDRIKDINEQISKLNNELREYKSEQMVALRALFSKGPTYPVLIHTEWGNCIMVDCNGNVHPFVSVDDLRAEEQKEA